MLSVDFIKHGLLTNELLKGGKLFKLSLLCRSSISRLLEWSVCSNVPSACGCYESSEV